MKEGKRQELFTMMRVYTQLIWQMPVLSNMVARTALIVLLKNRSGRSDIIDWCLFTARVYFLNMFARYLIPSAAMI